MLKNGYPYICLLYTSSVYHICEDEVKAETDPAVYEEQVGMMEMVMDVPAIHAEMEGIRKEYCKY